MNPYNINFLRRLLIYSAIVAAVTFALRLLLPHSYFSPTLPFLILFFLAVTFLSFVFLSRAFSKKFIRFVNTYLLVTIVKLFVYAVVMIAYVLLNRYDTVPFMIAFLLLYLCYTIFEVVFIVGITRQLPGSGSQE